MKTPVLVIGIVLLGIAGAGAGYYGGQLVASGPTPLGVAAGPLAAGTEPTAKPSGSPSLPLSRKTPVPSTISPLLADDLRFKTRNFSVEGTTTEQVRLSIKTPSNWQLTSSPKTPDEVKFLDPLKERAVRVQSGFPPDKSVVQSRLEIVKGLLESQPYQNDVQIKFQGESQVEGDDGRMRAVSTLVYTYVPIDVVRYVIVRWVATGDDDKATVEMSIAGLPQDVKALNEVLDQATKSVKFRD